MNLHNILPPSIVKRLYRNILRYSSPAFDAKVGINSTPGVLYRLKALGFSPVTILDIGAFEGKWSVMSATLFPRAFFHLFEPLPHKKEIIEKNTAGLDFRLHPVLLGAENKEDVPFFALESGSGVLSELTEIDRKIISMPMVRLDTQFDFETVQGPVFAKLDVQGYETEVLKGAGTGLQKMDAIYLELSTLPYNEGAPSLRQVIDFMDDQGFALFDLGECHRKATDDCLLQVDALFLSKSSTWYQKSSDLSGKQFWVYSV